MGWKKRFTDIYGEAAAKKWLPKLEKRIQSAKDSMKSEPADIKSQYVILITYPDQFFGGEDNLVLFEKFAEKYLDGVFDTVHFLPFCPYSSDDGFAVIDYRNLKEGLGSWEDLKRISNRFTLMYDFVCNHVSAKNEWFLKCLDGDKRYEKYFVEESPETDLSMVTRPRTTPLLTQFHAKNGEKYYWTTFSADQIDLNYYNPEVFWEAVDVFLTYLEQGGKWIRLDAVGFLWKEAGTSCMHHENTHKLVKLLRSILEEVYPAGRIVTETNVPHMDNVSYFGNGYDESHMVYQFPLPILVLYSFYKQNAQILSDWASGLSLPSDKTSFFNFLASHDGIGVNPIRSIVSEEEITSLIAHLQEKSGALVSYKENADGSKSAYEVNVSYFSAVKEDFDFETAKCRYLNAHSVLLGMQGDAAIYINSYLGIENDEECVRKTGMNRSVNRKKFEYAKMAEELAHP
ncbi:MAG: sugar phosphorylase, partial [Lachnospiraceae bacterium]|nr:sugar phosphorylase [Lachnospiraceae bacterium]